MTPAEGAHAVLRVLAAAGGPLLPSDVAGALWPEREARVAALAAGRVLGALRREARVAYHGKRIGYSITPAGRAEVENG